MSLQVPACMRMILLCFRVMSLQVPALQENDIVVQSARSDKSSLTSEQICSLVNTQVAESIQNILPQLLSESLQTSGLTRRMVEPSRAEQDDEASEESPAKRPKSTESPNEAPSGRGSRFYNEINVTTLSDDLLEFLTSTFTKSLSKEVWTELLDKYPSIKGTETVLVSPTMETGMKDDIKKKHGYLKTKDLFAFDEGLAEKQAPLLTAVRPIMAALEALDMPTEGDEDVSGPEPEDKDYAGRCPGTSWKRSVSAKFVAPTSFFRVFNRSG